MIADQPGLRTVRATRVRATPTSIEGYATLIGTEVDRGGLPIPYYRGSIVEGHSLPFVCDGEPAVRAARIHPRAADVIWLERHLRVTQLFMALGNAAFAMVLGRPNHERGGELPDLDGLLTVHVPAGNALLLDAGTWHDFPMAITDPVTVLTLGSAEVVEALASVREPGELDANDILKVQVTRRLGVRLVAELEPFT
jgi:ureidoglycolate lyase